MNCLVGGLLNEFAHLIIHNALGQHIQDVLLVLGTYYLSQKPLDMDKMLDTLGLTSHQDKLPSQLSGGQQQRCAIGRAIIKNPDILLCDEPTGALDSKTSIDILDLIDAVNKEFHNTIVMVTHNSSIGEMADRVVKLRDGMIRKEIRNTQRKSAKELEW
ncbi:MAG: ATP-binding cassette domain-containing protein [Lachnospiraceae bacterium]|nr:ATP-binding cassette domain-containing protein [Lachnospiraceae bacterium]